MSPDQRASRPLSSVDAAWLHMDEPTNPMVITIAQMFEGPIPFARLRELIEERLLPFERFRQRVVTWRSGGPHWEFDPRFALNLHLHHLGLPGEGDDAALRDLIGDLMSTPLDQTRPLWQMYLIDHYGPGCVLVLRVHHCLADGMALGQIYDKLLDQPITEAPPVLANGHASPGLIDNAFERIGSAVRTTEQIIQGGWSWVSHPERTMGLLGSSAAVLGKLALMGPDAPNIFRGQPGLIKRAAWANPVPLAAIKAVGKLTGGTVNDVLLSAVAGALRRYMDQHAAVPPLRGVRAMVPVNLLPPGAKTTDGNNFGLVYVTLPVSVDEPLDRMIRVRREMEQIKTSPEAHVAYGVISMLGAMPVDLEHTMLDMLCNMASMIITNVPGPRRLNSMGGVRMDRVMFWVPESSKIGLGISLISYAGAVQIGVVADAGIVPDPEVLAEAFDQEFIELAEALQLA